jgi:putative SOS response-associated peptidase YedK
MVASWVHSRATVDGVCGRYASSRSSFDLATLFDVVDETQGALLPDYNIAPTDPSAIVLPGLLCMARWGLFGTARMINARAETIVTKRAFGDAFVQRRCLVPADGWYEWRREEGRRQPYFMTRTDGEALAFGGVWTGSGDAITFSIITLPATDELTCVHERMPLIIEPWRWRDWLTTDRPGQMLEPPTIDYRMGVEIRPVSGAVGNVRNDGPQLIERVPRPSSTVEPTLF